MKHCLNCDLNCDGMMTCHSCMCASLDVCKCVQNIPCTGEQCDQWCDLGLRTAVVQIKIKAG